MTTPNPNIALLNEAQYAIDAARLTAAAAQVIQQHDLHPESAVTLVLESDAYIQNLNLQFRGVDAPTDVLSFPADAPPPEIAEESDEPPYLGDLIIAYPYAVAQAQRENHDINDSLALLVVHGTLHLIGYDHDTPENRAEMWEVQAEALQALGISPDIVPALERYYEQQDD